MTILRDLRKFGESLSVKSGKTPLLFIGHGSPMNAIEQNEFSKGWMEIGKTLPEISAILCISAHWETKGTFVTAMENPKTIHDFGGFPQELFDVQYAAKGSPAVAQQTKDLVKKTVVGLDNDQWGLDHGCWSVLKNLYPQANVPVLQLSMDYTQNAQWHYDLAKELSELRSKGVLILGSGNMVHNLRIINWQNPEAKYDWAESINEKMKSFIRNNDHKSLIEYSQMGNDAKLAIPTPEHYLPMLYILGLKNENESVSFFNDKTIMGSISMSSFISS